MKKDNLYTGTEAREKLMSGIKKVASAVGATMGTGGSNAILEAIENPGHLMTNDGYSIANSIVLADPIEEMGRKILVESINRANKHSGDGSSTTAVLTAAIIEEGSKHLGEASPMDIKRSLEACIPLIEASIKSQTRELYVAGEMSLKMLEEVATISAEDAGIGKTIAEIYSKIGKSGIIHWDVSKTAEDTYTVGQGITVEGAKFYSPYMTDATESGQSTGLVRLKDPLILITKQKISSAADFNDIGQMLYNKDIRDVVVFCDDVDPLVIPDIVKTRMVRGFRFILVKMPIWWKDEWFEDLALASGAKVVDPAAGTTLKGLKYEDLGKFDSITITNEDTFIDGIKDLSAHIGQLEAQATDATALRASRLNTKTARYFVGAQSDSALSYRRLKVEDAIAAAYQALNGGIVAGGGVALMDVADKLPDTTGGKILSKALDAPFNQIVSNAGKSGYVLSGTTNTGVDTRTGALVDMFEAGIVDPAIIVMNCVKNAISVAATVLTANTVVILPREEVDPGIPQRPVLQ